MLENCGFDFVIGYDTKGFNGELGTCGGGAKDRRGSTKEHDMCTTSTHIAMCSAYRFL